MKDRKRFDRLCIAVMAAAILLTVLFMNGERLGVQLMRDDDAERNSSLRLFTDNDRNSSWDSSAATRIELTGTGAEIRGTGAYLLGRDVVLAETGAYVISGELTDAAIVVDAHKTSKLWILFDGVSVTRDGDACFRIERADKVFLTLAEGSVNSLASTGSRREEAEADGVNGALCAEDDLTVNGAGSLSISCAFGHGIHSKDKLVIAGGTLQIDAARDAIHVAERLAVENASLTLTAGDDGIDVQGKGVDASERIWLDPETVTLSVSAGDLSIEGAGEEEEPEESGARRLSLGELSSGERLALLLSLAALPAALCFAVFTSRRKKTKKSESRS